MVGGVRILHQLQLGVLFLGEARLHVLNLFRHLHQLTRAADAPAHQLLLASAKPGSVRLALVVRLANSRGGRSLRLTGVGESLLALDDLGIRFKPRSYALDVLAKPAFAHDQLLMLEEELGRFRHSSTTSTWPSFTTSVSLTRISFTVPARGAHLHRLEDQKSVFLGHLVTRLGRDLPDAADKLCFDLGHEEAPERDGAGRGVASRPSWALASALVATSRPRSRTRRLAFSTRSPLLFAILPSST